VERERRPRLAQCSQASARGGRRHHEAGQPWLRRSSTDAAMPRAALEVPPALPHPHMHALTHAYMQA
jgi:hypothetical protein